MLAYFQAEGTSELFIEIDLRQSNCFNHAQTVFKKNVKILFSN